MVYCYDTDYFTDYAQTSCVGKREWSDAESSFELTDTITEINKYESNSLNKRELPYL